MSTHRIDLGPGDDVIVTGHGMTEAKLVRGKDGAPDRKRVKDNRPAPAPVTGTGTPAEPIDVTGAPNLSWNINVKGNRMTARQLLVAAGGGATFAYTPPEPPPPPDPDPDPEDPPDPPPPPESAEYEGYGSLATGGLTPYVVTTLADSGSGSLRNALNSSVGQLAISFAVQGNITLLSQLNPAGDDILLDGSEAPGGGVTLKGAPILWSGRTNIIVRELRFRDQDLPATADGMTFKSGCENIIVDHCSFQGATDGQVDFTRECSNVTVQWCIIGPGSGVSKISLVGTGSDRITYHHNLIYEGATRQPQAQFNDAGFAGSVSQTVTDVRCNVIWAPTNGLYGSAWNVNAIGNCVRNYYYMAQTGSNRAIHTETGGSVYASGNYSRNGGALTGHTSRSETSVPAYAVVTMESTAQLAAAAVIADAGCRVGGLASYDQTKIDAIETAGL